MSALVAMHAPDGFLEVPVAVATAVIAAGFVTAALAVARRHLGDRQIPLAGVAAAFIFAAQMFNFPVAAGTTGHLLGGALAAILLGPWLGLLVVTVVVVIQALFFADGGLTALGYNVVNMAVVPAFAGWALFRLFRRWLAPNRSGVGAASGLAAVCSVVLAAVAFSIEWLFGASAPVPFDRVFGAMVGVHALIGLGEGVITAGAIGAVLGSRPDLVAGAHDLSPEQSADRGGLGLRPFVIGGCIVALVCASVIGQFAFDNPDGLERVAIDHGFAQAGTDHALASSPLADYATQGVGNETVSLAIAGAVGVALSLIVISGVLAATRPLRRRGAPA